MATYYWRGGTATWGTGQNANWSINGAAVAYGFYNPGAADDVVFDATSGTCTVTINGARSINNLTMTGFTGILTGTGQGAITINGSTCTLSSSGTFDPANYPTLTIQSSNCTLTSNGQTIGHLTFVGGSTGNLYLADNLQTTNNGILTLTSGTINTQGYRVAVGYFTDVANGISKTLNMGASYWTLMGDGPVAAIGTSAGPEQVWNISQPASFTLTRTSSTLNLMRARYVSTLASTKNSGATSITLRDIVTDNAGNSAWPTAGTVIVCPQNVAYGITITYTGRTGNTLTGISAIVGDTLPNTIDAGAQVFLVEPKTTTLTNAIPNGTDTSTIIVGDNSPFGNEGFIQIDDEVISYTGKSGTTGFTGITRSTAYGISGASHSSGAIVRPVEGVVLNTGGKIIPIYTVSVGHVQYATINGVLSTDTTLSYYIRSSINGKTVIITSDTTITSYLSPYYYGGPVNSITPPSSINEGSAGTFNVSTREIYNGTTLYWTINNTTTTNADFSATSGSFTVTGNAIDGATGSYNITPAADSTTEGSETFTVTVRRVSTSGPVVATSTPVTISDTSTAPTPTYSVSGINNVNEGNGDTFSVTTTNVSNGTTLYWTVNHVTTTSADFSATSGSFTITSNAGSFTVTPSADSSTEGGETFTVSIRTGSTSGTIVATSSSQTIVDTSQTPITYAFGTIPTSINEGSSGTFNVSCTGIVNGTSLYWTIATNSGDFGTTSGTFAVTGNYASTTGSFTVTPTADNLTEGAETFTVNLRTGSTSGTIVATSSTVTINDTSVAVSTSTEDFLPFFTET